MHAKVIQRPQPGSASAVYKPWGSQRDRYYLIEDETGKRHWVRDWNVRGWAVPGDEGLLTLFPAAPGSWLRFPTFITYEQMAMDERLGAEEQEASTW